LRKGDPLWKFDLTKAHTDLGGQHVLGQSLGQQYRRYKIAAYKTRARLEPSCGSCFASHLESWCHTHLRGVLKVAKPSDPIAKIIMKVSQQNLSETQLGNA
jgi:hypothetical protein